MDESDSQKFCLKWNNFHSNFMTQFETLKEDEDFVDVTLSCYGQSIKAHKVVLSACSPYLKNIFKEHPCKHPVIILDNLTFKNLESVIQFVYTGQVYVEQTELSSFLKAAEALQIRGLSDPSATQNLMQPVQPLNFKSDQVKSLRKRESDDESDFKKSPAKRISRKNSIVSAGGSGSYVEERKETKSNTTENEEIDCSTVNNEKSDGKGENSSLNLLAEMECSIENADKEMTSSMKSEEYPNGEQKKPHWLDPRSCPLCNRVYSNLSNLRQHMKLIHNPSLVTCKLCCKTFKTDLYLRRHLSSFHSISMTANSWFSLPSHPPPCGQNVKSEPEAFAELFGGAEMYQVPQ